MLKGLWILENWNYTDSWNVFSRALFLLDTLKDKKSLIVVDTPKDLKKYKETFNILGINLTEINNKSVIADYIFSDFWIFIALKEFFELNINLYEFKKMIF